MTVTPGGGVDRQHDRNEGFVARLVRVDVIAVGQANLQRRADLPARVHAIGIDNRGELGADRAVAPVPTVIGRQHDGGRDQP